MQSFQIWVHLKIIPKVSANLKNKDPIGNSKENQKYCTKFDVT